MAAGFTPLLKYVGIVIIIIFLSHSISIADVFQGGHTDHGIYFDAGGNGVPVILLHGGGLDSRMWDKTFGHLSKTHTVIRYDIRGFGKSEPAEDEFSHLQDLSDLMDYLDIERATLIGLSLGGMISLDFTVAYPEKVERLVLIGTGARGWNRADDVVEGFRKIFQTAQNEGAEAAVEVWLRDPHMAPAMENPYIANRIREISLENKNMWLGGMQPVMWPETPPVERLEEIDIPVLVIIGERDVHDLHDLADFIVERIPSAEKAVIPDAGHLPNMESPEKFHTIIDGFLNY